MNILKLLNNEEKEMYRNDAYFHYVIDLLRLNGGDIPIEKIIQIVFELCKSNKIKLDKIRIYHEKYGYLVDR